MCFNGFLPYNLIFIFIYGFFSSELSVVFNSTTMIPLKVSSKCTLQLNCTSLFLFALFGSNLFICLVKKNGPKKNVHKKVYNYDKCNCFLLYFYNNIFSKLFSLKIGFRFDKILRFVGFGFVFTLVLRNGNTPLIRGPILIIGGSGITRGYPV